MLNYQVLLPLLLAYAVISYIVFKKKVISKVKYFSCLCLAIYLTGVIAVTLFPIPIDKRLIQEEISLGYYTGRYNLIPFKTVMGLIKNSRWGMMTAIRNIAGNIVLLLPLGFLVPLIWNRVSQFKKLIAVGLLSTLSIELIQVLLSVVIGYQYKSFDVDDIILNSIGYIIGVIAYKLIYFLKYKMNITV